MEKWPVRPQNSQDPEKKDYYSTKLFIIFIKPNKMHHLKKSPFSGCTDKPYCIFKGEENYDNRIDVLEGQVEKTIGINLKI